ncbi:MAG TPA: Crp/Fnr family transcriptional regulator [Syntrophorhabdaceae bacterium]|nr:Crp/Fnr family transcriptional regulator [Syntrophorhabdaceae bacterium]HOL05390.1 Crp/Fnr family transcriptional regulator [Syntrophorhabdaceae bacterium]HON86437.1 Crp/Fnr family transcriptional regulator [Syntrophorhabdaceae bacterium]HOT42901.1 Crp/Fnr family transcriptional regulator [Syntrophorhabdaceae bacterium]HPC67637.1 Crp/Fnr family transcriptional regulator [Syntrophorhabdaceae bacterium]
MIRYLDTIRNVSLFNILEDEDIKLISRIATTKTIPKGFVVFQEGEKGDALYIILKGKVKVSLYDDEGREYILDIIGKDGFFGELSILDDLPRSANIVTTEDCEFIILKRHDFIKLLMENPAITVNILKTMAARLRAADERIKGLAFFSVEGRILKYLIEVGEETGIKIKNHIIIENGPTQLEIASSCGCSRETVSRMLKSLVNKGIITVRKRQYTLYTGHLSF